MGLSSIWVLDRLLLPSNPRDLYGGRPWPDAYGTTYDPIETLTLAAAKTERIRLGSSIIDALFQSPILLARRLATLDVISGGRLTAGLSQGWSRDEFQASSIPYSRRGNGFEEYIRAVRAVWGPDPVAFSGRFFSIPESKIGPKPIQSKGPPIIAGGQSPVAFERAGRMADGLTFGAVFAPSWEKFNQVVNIFRSSAVASHRDLGELEVIVRINRPISEREVEEPRPPLSGDASQIAEDASILSTLGVNHMFFDMNFAEIPPDQQLRLVGQLRDAI